MNRKWSLNSQNNVLWSIDAKLFLISQVRNNTVVLNKETTAKVIELKDAAWHRIYKSCIKAGMPDVDLERFKKYWSRLKSQAIKNMERYAKQKRRRVKITQRPSVIDTAIDELLQHHRSTKNMQFPVPKVSIIILLIVFCLKNGAISNM